MNIRTIERNGVVIAIVESEDLLITDVQSALDLIATVYFDYGTSRVIVNKAAVSDDFFILSRGLAGEILQKFINYQAKIAIVGDFSRYSSKPLQAFMYESNNGRDVFFVGSEEEAIERLSLA